MQIALFSDVHGNLTALEAVLADIKKQTPDVVFFAGDLCLFGPRPAACVDRVRAEPISAIYGNTDQLLSNDPLLSDDLEEEKKERRRAIEDIVDWTRVQLSEEQHAWLTSLPFHRRVSPTPHPKDDLFIVHANPKDANQSIYPSEAVQKAIYGEVRQSDNDVELRHLLQDLFCGVLAFGHVHVPNIRQWQDMTLANISSVSLPEDGDPRAKYGLLSWDKHDGWTVAHRYVAYDMDEEISWFKQQQVPEWQKYVHELEAVRP